MRILYSCTERKEDGVFESTLVFPEKKSHICAYIINDSNLPKLIIYKINEENLNGNKDVIEITIPTKLMSYKY